MTTTHHRAKQERTLKQQVNDMGERAQYYLDMLPETGDVLLVTLKGHLIIEELLNAIVSKHFANPRRLIEARLGFAQLLSLARGLSAFLDDTHLWTAVAKLNALRNAFAHNLRPNNISKRIRDLVHAATAGGEVPIPRKVRAEGTLVKYCVACIMGSLSVVEGVEEVITTALPTSSRQLSARRTRRDVPSRSTKR